VRETVRDLIYLTVSNELYPGVCEEFQSVVHLIRSYARLAEPELAAEEKPETARYARKLKPTSAASSDSPGRESLDSWDVSLMLSWARGTGISWRRIHLELWLDNHLGTLEFNEKEALLTVERAVPVDAPDPRLQEVFEHRLV
jgi:hypothetical protein